MSNNKMLIDASHPEETRVVVLRNNRIEEFDFEAADKKPLRGNIYLAKVTRVEPSLQAAFVEYGGNRHGFLAFSEIHPDYYQIPVADRIALLEDEAREQREEAAEEEKRSNRRSNNRRRRGGRQASRSSRRDESRSAEASIEGDPSQENDSQENSALENIEQENLDQENLLTQEDGAQGTGDDTAQITDSHSTTDSDPAETGDQPTPVDAAVEQDQTPESPGTDGDASERSSAAEASDSSGTDDTTAPAEAAGSHNSDEIVETASAEPDEQSATAEAGAEISSVLEGDILPPGGQENNSEEDSTEGDDASGDDSDASDEEDEDVEQLGGDSEEDMQPAPRRSRRHYKIQEVIKRRQIMLIQVVKEERGNKGAALTSYLSLAGRYSVLMPNTARGGGISRKITDGDDRRRLKGIVQELEVPEGMGIILRTAGASRTNQEVRRDFEYLLRLWESVREMTLHSSAPTLVYEEGSLVKRSIRDLYGKEVDEVMVSGAEGYREAKDFMRMLMPSHARNVKQWREPQPMFAKSGVEPQLDSLFSPNVTLKSGGYIVINQTEALVAIDVNSGRSTREHNIEDTALRTNQEAADEVARQLRLRDLAGLIVVDFIDMEEHRNNRAVERRMKDALKNDRARIQVGRISHFGLLEMSRQRMRTGVLEGSSVICAHCQGSGTVRSNPSIALHVLRLTEEALLRNNNFDLIVRTRSEVALYILNQKRATLMELESRFGVALTINADDSMTGTTYHAIERGEAAVAPVPAANQALQFSSPADEEADDDDLLAEAEEADNTEADEASASDSENGEGRKPARSRGGARRSRGGRTRKRDGDAGDEEAGTPVTEAKNTEQDTEADASNGDAEEDGQKRRRRRRRRGRNDRPSSGISAEAPQPSDDGLAFITEARSNSTQPENGSPETDSTPATADEASSSDDDSNTRRKGQRGGFRGRRRNGADTATEVTGSTGEAADAEAAQASADIPADDISAEFRTGTWIKSSDQPEKSDTPVQTYPFSSPRADIPEPIQQEAPVASASPADIPANDDVAASEAPDGSEAAPASEPVLETKSESNGYMGSATPENGVSEDPAPSREPRMPEELPEAPPPPVKKSGWWKR